MTTPYARLRDATADIRAMTPRRRADTTAVLDHIRDLCAHPVCAACGGEVCADCLPDPGAVHCQAGPHHAGCGCAVCDREGAA